MSYVIQTGKDFDVSFKKLSKRYRSLLDDYDCRARGAHSTPHHLRQGGGVHRQVECHQADGPRAWI